MHAELEVLAAVVGVVVAAHSHCIVVGRNLHHRHFVAVADIRSHSFGLPCYILDYNPAGRIEGIRSMLAAGFGRIADIEVEMSELQAGSWARLDGSRLVAETQCD